LTKKAPYKPDVRNPQVPVRLGIRHHAQALADANEAAAARDASLETVLRELGGRSYREIAAELTSRAIVSPRSGVWIAMTVIG
jgi:CBS-domain-containing membrane protein